MPPQCQNLGIAIPADYFTCRRNAPSGLPILWPQAEYPEVVRNHTHILTNSVATVSTLRWQVSQQTPQKCTEAMFPQGFQGSHYPSVAHCRIHFCLLLSTEVIKAVSRRNGVGGSSGRAADDCASVECSDLLEIPAPNGPPVFCSAPPLLVPALVPGEAARAIPFPYQRCLRRPRRELFRNTCCLRRLLLATTDSSPEQHTHGRSLYARRCSHASVNARDLCGMRCFAPCALGILCCVSCLTSCCSRRSSARRLRCGQSPLSNSCLQRKTHVGWSPPAWKHH